MIKKIVNIYDIVSQNHPKKMKIFRYLISGGMATLTNLLFLFIFTDVFNVWYIISAILSYLISFAVSFSMQKYWTFRNHSNDRIKSQAVIYIVVTTTNLGLNTLGIFILVHYFGVYYLFAQIMVSILIAIESYFVYHYLFRTRTNQIIELPV